MPPPPSPRAVHYTTHASILRPCAEPQGCRGAFHSFILAAAAAFADSPRPGARPASVPHHYQGVAVVCRVQAAVVQARRRNGPSVALPASRRTEASPPPPSPKRQKNTMSAIQIHTEHTTYYIQVHSPRWEAVHSQVSIGKVSAHASHEAAWRCPWRHPHRQQHSTAQ